MRNYLFLLSFLFPFGAAAANFPAPDVLARTVTEEVLSLIRADKELQAGNPQRVYELIETKIAPHFNFTGMTQLAMGRNWREASAAQRKALTAEFRTLLVRTYTTAFTQYRNQTVEYRPLKLAPSDNDVLVRSLVKQPSGPPVAIDYRMEKTPEGWKVYNVLIEGISLIENYRNTFNTEVQKHGVDGLIRSLAERNQALQQQAAGK
jgi:phospholipid transport system substrate-binding protein